MPTSKIPKFAIIGAGTAGLSTAILLARQNIHVTLFEKVNDAEQQQQNIIRRGYWSIFVHPQQIPFWCFWGIFLIKKFNELKEKE